MGGPLISAISGKVLLDNDKVGWWSYRRSQLNDENIWYIYSTYVIQTNSFDQMLSMNIIVWLNLAVCPLIHVIVPSLYLTVYLTNHMYIHRYM